MPAVVIVGAGPVGARAAGLIAEQGWEVKVLEEHSEAGKPENCTGLVSATGLKELGINAEQCIENKVFGAEIIAPDKTTFSVSKKEPVAFVLNRAKFDKMLCEEARKKGAEIEFNAKFINKRNENIFIQKHAHGEMRKGNIVIGADGILSKTRELAGTEIPKKYFLNSYQERVEGSFEEKKAKLFLGDFAKGLFGWIVPESSKIARIGIGTLIDRNAKQAFEEFRQKHSLEFECIEKNSFLIASGPPIEETVKESFLLAGEAAFHSKATTGGGIVMGLEAAEKCAETISEHLKNKTSLGEYKNSLKPLNKELKTHWKMRCYLNSLNDKKINKIMAKMKKAGLEEFLEEHGDMDRPSRFLGKMALKPRFWGLLPAILRVR